MTATTMIRVRVEDEVKAQATEALAAMGLTNAQTRAAIEESRTLAKGRRARLQSAQAVFDELETPERP